MAPSARVIERYLARVRGRAVAFLAMRAAVAGAGAAAVTLTGGGWAAGPLAPLWVVALIWLVAGVASSAAIASALLPVHRLRGGNAARLLESVRSDLVSPLRSAFELGRGGGGPSVSGELVEAHAARLCAEIVHLPPSRVVPLRWVEHPIIGAGLMGIAFAGLLLFGSDRAMAGAWTLLHPGERDGGGIPVVAAFRDVRARLVFPAYFRRPAERISEPVRFEVPLGTTIEIAARARIPARAAELEVAGRSIPMDREGETWIARFSVRGEAPIALRLQGEDGIWVRDATARAIHVVPDRAPQVTLLSPAADATVDAGETVAVAFDAQDDVGVVSADLVIRGADGRERRRRIATPEAPVLQLRGEHPITMDETGARPGDRVELWIEARDGDDVSGPHVGRSEIRTLTLASEATRRERSIEELEALLDLAIDALADRLDMPPAAEEAAARARFASVRSSTESVIRSLDAHAQRIRAGAGRRTDAVLYSEAASRLRRLLFEEMRLHEPTLAALAARQSIDRRAVDELENDVLLVADLLTRARVEDAAAIARELEQLRREIASLLAELRRTDGAEARARLLVAIARAEQRLAELRARMTQMGTAIPQEFANAQDTEMRETADALSSLREALERGDLETAHLALTRLEQQIDALARALGAGESSFTEARFGPRERALAEALDRLVGLESEQRELAHRTGELRSLVARRALDAVGQRSAEAARRLTGRVRTVREALEPIVRGRLSSLEREALDALDQRLRDLEDALATGDLGEATQMVESAVERSAELERDLELEAMMFPGHDGQTARAARAAAEAARRLAELRAAFEQVLPNVGDHVSGTERARMQADASRQRTVESAASELAERIDHSPDGMPLAPDIAAGLRNVVRTMEEAARGLERGDPPTAARAQEEAARRLSELREQMEQDTQRTSGGGAGGSDHFGPFDPRSAVRIHGADEFAGPMELRRRILDSMQDAPPAGYESAVRRYYEGLLR